MKSYDEASSLVAGAAALCRGGVLQSSSVRVCLRKAQWESQTPLWGKKKKKALPQPLPIKSSPNTLPTLPSLPPPQPFTHTCCDRKVAPVRHPGRPTAKRFTLLKFIFKPFLAICDQMKSTDYLIINMSEKKWQVCSVGGNRGLPSRGYKGRGRLPPK